MAFLNNLRLKSKDPRTRRKAIESLDLDREDPQTFQVLTTSLADEDPQVRSAAAKAMGWIQQDDRPAELLIPLLRDLAPEVRQAAVAALGTCVTAAPPARCRQPSTMRLPSTSQRGCRAAQPGLEPIQRGATGVV